MRKQVRLALASSLFLMILMAACSPQLKTVSRDVNSTATRTPFLVKATYTSESPVLEMAENEVVNPAAVTATPDPEEGEIPTEPAITEESSPTSTSTEDNSQDNPTSTPKHTEPAATAKPTKPPATAKPTKPPADTSTPKPPADTSTPKPPPADTNTPKPPSPTNTPVTPEPTQECSPAGNSGYETEVINLINQERAAEGLPALTANSKLTSAARRHSADMACTDTWSHTGSDGSTPASRISDAGYSWSRVTENIAASSSQYFSPSSVVNLWMNSPGHKANILDPNVIHIGVGFRFFDNGGYDAYYTADFARP